MSREPASILTGPRSTTPRWIVAATGLLATLAMLEGIARIEGPVVCIEDASTLLSADPEVGWTFTPDLSVQVESCSAAPGERGWRSSVSINHHGLADQEWPYAKRPGEVRVLLLGDERADGIGLARADRLSVRLSHLADQVRGARVSGINAALPGYGPAESLRWLERRGLAYAPDIVVLLLDPAADPTPRTSPLVPTSAPAVLPPSFGPLGRSAALRWLRGAGHRPEAVVASAPSPEAVSPRPASRERLVALVADLAARSRAAGARFAVVVAPSCPPAARDESLCPALASVAPCTDLQGAFADLRATRGDLADLCLPGTGRWGRDAHFLASHQLWSLLDRDALWPPTVRRGHRL